MTSLGSVTDNVDSGLAITYKVGSTTLTGPYAFPLGVTTVTMDASDTAGNAAVQQSFTVTVTDSEPPTVGITGAPGDFIGTALFNLTITFSEPVSGFATGDISLRNANVVTLTGSGTTYAAQLKATGAGDVTVQVPAGAAQDAAGNGNLASEVVTIKNLNVEETQKKIAQFMYDRSNQLIANQPDLTCFLSGGCGNGGINVTSTRNKLAFDLKSGAGWPVWFRVGGSKSTSGTAEDTYLFGAFGTHRYVGANTLVGMMLEVDHIDRSEGTGEIGGTGWLAGPYVVTRLPDQPLFFEARALWGRSNNTIRPFGTHEDAFETHRFLAHLKLSGQVTLNDLTLMPHLTGSYAKDTQLTYVDGLGNTVPEQGVDVRQVAFGLDFSKPVSGATRDWMFGGGVSVSYSPKFGQCRA
ncbi:Ig-like domain-containing protein [Aliiroseovarius sp. xm-m-378]|uniref:Ig-like domain-containing protein n=1 Tax=unclassified Aliiroseovarius TaxID=2623558 RepID=UPI001569C49F